MFPTGSIQACKCAGCGAIVAQSEIHFCSTLTPSRPDQYQTLQGPMLLQIIASLNRIEALLKDKGDPHA
jgi:hypothetical protein